MMSIFYDPLGTNKPVG